MPDRDKPERARRASIPMLWVLGAVAIGLASWLEPNLASLDRGELFSMSPFGHYGLSVGAWFLVFGGGYLLIERLRLPFARTASWVHFGLMALGSALIMAPSVALGLVPDPVATTNTISLFPLLNDASMLGYALTWLALVVFLGALGRSVWVRITTKRA